MSNCKWHIVCIGLAACFATGPVLASQSNPWAMPRRQLQPYASQGQTGTPGTGYTYGGQTGTAPYAPPSNQARQPAAPVVPAPQTQQPYRPPSSIYGDYPPLPQGKSPSVLERPEKQPDQRATGGAQAPYYSPWGPMVPAYPAYPAYPGYYGGYGGYGGLGYGLLPYAPQPGLWPAPLYGY